MTKQISAITQVPGFRAIGLSAGIKPSGDVDFALILAQAPCTAAAVFTQNSFKAAPVLYDAALLARNGGTLQAIVINAGNANAVTGAQGLADAEQMARLTETTCGLPHDSTFVMSTGIIGHSLPMDNIFAGVKQANQQIQTTAGEQGLQVAQAIMTTDLVPKEAYQQTEIMGKPAHIGGIAKGSGMIEPNMATMLGVVVTDVAIDTPTLNVALKQAVESTFNAVTVDGDTSTNDTVVILASGQAENTPITNTESDAFRQFTAALTDVCEQLAKAIARDGEGATKLIEIRVTEARSFTEAKQVAKTIANSPLVKTALFGNDPNWGRIFMAAGRSGVELEPAYTSLKLGDLHLVQQGEPLVFDRIAANEWLTNQTEVTLELSLGLGEATATVWTCDFSYKYVEINAEYHT